MTHERDAAVRCQWCGQPGATPQPRTVAGIVTTCPGHSAPMQAYLAATARNSRWTVLASVLSVLLFIGGGMVASGAVVASGLLVLGIGLWFFPYGTPDAVRRLGARRAIGLARRIGLASAALGAAGFVLALMTR